MNKRIINYRFHDESPDETAERLLRVCIEVSRKKVEAAVRSRVEQAREVRTPDDNARDESA